MGKRVQALFAALVGLLFAAVFAASASAAGGLSVGHSGWTWGDPSPQGNDLRSVEFIGNRGYTAGKFGTLLRSDDAGASWTGLSTGTMQDLSLVRVIDADSIVIAGGCVVRRSDDAGQTFTRLPWTASDQRCNGEVASVHFPSNEVGYIVVQNGSVLRTADGGQTWTRRTAVPGTPSSGGTAMPKDVFFATLDIGVATDSVGNSYRTVDGGNSWTLVTTTLPATTLSMNGVYFFDANNGYVVGNDHVFVTTDGGATWTGKAPNHIVDFSSIRCSTPTTCLLASTTGDSLLRTTDGGDTYASITPSTQKIFAVAFASPTRAVAVGASGATVVSDDAGVTWSRIGRGVSDDFARVRATSSRLAVTVGANGALAKTTDGGATWVNVGVSTSANVVDASFPSDNTGYALDSDGTVLRTDNGGTSWKILDTGTNADPRALLALDANRLLLIGPRGVRRSTDGGGSFERVRARGVTKSGLFDYDRAGQAVFTFGFKALYVSTTGGKSWKKVKRPPTRADLQAVDFVSSKRGFALTFDGHIWQTTNGGRRWREIPGIGNADAFELAFSDSRNGFAAVRDFGGKYNGYVMRTNDGGKTWQPQLVDDDGIDSDGLVATGANSAIALSLGNGLFATTTGGQAGGATALSLSTKKRKLRKKATIQVTGKLSPAEGGEQVVVSMRGARLSKWRQQTVTAAANGSFTTSWKVSATSYFVAQWSGDDTRAGDGSKLLTVKVR